jgi:hypothetical protein
MELTWSEDVRSLSIGWLSVDDDYLACQLPKPFLLSRIDPFFHSIPDFHIFLMESQNLL